MKRKRTSAVPHKPELGLYPTTKKSLDECTNPLIGTVTLRYNAVVGTQVYLTSVQARHVISFQKVFLQMLHTGRHRYSNWQHAEYSTNEPDINVTNRKRITIQNSSLETNIRKMIISSSLAVTV